MKRTKTQSRIDRDTLPKRARTVLSYTKEIDDETLLGVVNWIENISGELWMLALEKAGAGRLDFDWIQKFSSINKDTLRYTYSSELWRYMYETMLVAPAARPTHLLENLTNVSTGSYNALREESSIHYTFFLPYVFHYGKKEDWLNQDDVKVIFEKPSDLPSWKVWKRMVEVLRRQRTAILNKMDPTNTDNTTKDPSSYKGYSDYGDAVRLYDTNTGNSDDTLGTSYDDEHTSKEPSAYRLTERSQNDINFTVEEFEDEREMLPAPRYPAVYQDMHLSLIDYNSKGNVITTSLPACPWPIIYGIDNEKGAWIGLLLANKTIYASQLQFGHLADDRFGKMDRIFSLVPQPDGLLNIFCLATARDINENFMEDEPLIVMHTVRLDVLIEKALEHIRNLEHIWHVSQVEWHMISDFVVGKPRVMFSLKPDSSRFRTFPSYRWIMDKRFTYAPLALSASRRYLAFTFHHGCQLFEWNYLKHDNTADDLKPYDFFYWEQLSNANFLPPVSSKEYADAPISELYTNQTTVLPHIRMMMHSPDVGWQQTLAAMNPIIPDIHMGHIRHGRSKAPYPQNGLTKHVDIAEIQCDPLGSNRLIIVIGIFRSLNPAYDNPITHVEYTRVDYLAFGMVMHPAIANTKINYIGFYETHDTITPGRASTDRLLRSSIDGVAILIPTPTFVHDIEDPTIFLGMKERVTISIVGWIDVSDKRQTLPRLSVFSYSVSDAFLARQRAWAYLPGGLVILAQYKKVGYKRAANEVTCETTLSFMLPARGGWRARDGSERALLIARVFRNRVKHYNVNVDSLASDVALMAGGNLILASTMLSYQNSVTMHELMINLSNYELGPKRSNGPFVTYVPKNGSLPDASPATSPLTPNSSQDGSASLSMIADENLDELVDVLYNPEDDERMVPRPGPNNYLSSKKITYDAMKRK